MEHNDVTTPDAGSDDGEALSMAEAVDALSSSDAGSFEQPADDDDRRGESGDGIADDDDGAEDHDGEDQPDDEDGDEPGDGSGGPLAADHARVTLEDGTTVTVADLKRGHLRTGDYTRKTQDLAERRRAFEASQSEMERLQSQLAQEREFVAGLARNILPEKPQIEAYGDDLAGFMQAKAAYDERVGQLNQLTSAQQAASRRAAAAEQQAAQQHRQAEASRLLETMPELGRPDRYARFMGDAAEVMANHYGFSPDEVGEAMDHRFYPVFRDLAAYQRIKAGRGRTQKAVEGRPEIMRGGKRRGPGAERAFSRKAAKDRLNKTGSLKDGVALLMMQDEGG